MQMKPDLLLQQIARLIDARAKTTETNLKAEIKASEERTKKELRSEIQVVKGELKSEIVEARKELQGEIQDTKQELQSDINSINDNVNALRKGVAKKLVEQEERLEAVEKATGTSSKH